MSYQLESLLNIRKNKYEKAKALKLVLLNALDDAKKNIQICQKNVDDYILQKEIEIDKKYALIINKILSRQDLDLFFDELNKINDKEIYLLTKLKEAQNHKDDLQEQYNKAIQDLSISQRSFYKLKEHKKLYLKDLQIQKDKDEENELSEFLEFKYQKRAIL